MQSGNGRGVQQAEVSAAADALLAQGQRPTVDRVRRQLGRGSPNTVGPMLETWFVGLAPRLGYPSSENGSTNAPPAEVSSSYASIIGFQAHFPTLIWLASGLIYMVIFDFVRIFS